MQSLLPVAVIGSGPVGLAAAAHLLRRGLRPLILEAGAAVASSVRAWGHVQIFSPWRYTVDAAARDLLVARGWKEPPPEEHPTGAEIVEDYLEPLARVPEVASALRLGTKVVAITRRGADKMKSASDRDARPFVLRVVRDGVEEEVLAQAVIDASGTFRTPSPLGSDGLPALGERELRDRIAYGVPDVAGKDRGRYAGRRVLVAGSGHSAFNVLIDLAALAQEAPGTQVRWVLRRQSLGQLFGGGAADQLPERGSLGQAVRSLVESGRLQMHLGFSVRGLRQEGDGIVVTGEEGALPPVDEIVAATGFRPDLEMLRELRLGMDNVVESPTALAPLIDPNVHSCGSVPPHGAEELGHPEAGFYIVGMKSYGRAPTFLMLTGYEQVRSVVAAIAGDWESARRVELVLPETGVCSLDREDEKSAETSCSKPDYETAGTSRTAGTAASGCCGGPAAENAEACCKLDEQKKANGEEGCGCNSGGAAAAAGGCGTGALGTTAPANAARRVTAGSCC